MLETLAEVQTKWWRPFSKADRRSLALLVALPVLIFAVPAMLGHPAIAADNLIQNFPLRVLVGEQLRSGHLPLFNPLSNSGTPLLGGMNAGAFFPLTLIFTFLPGVLAWVLNLIAVYAAAGVGLFALLRSNRLGSVASLVGSLVFAYTGAMLGQLPHLAVVQGFALLPWMIVCLQSLSAMLVSSDVAIRHLLKSCTPQLLGMALIWGLIFLSGEPRAIAEMELLVLVVAPCLLLISTSQRIQSWRNRMVFLALVGVGLAWGAVIGLIQLLPGWDFIGLSERSAISYQFFGSGSLPVRWTALLFSPNILGGNGILHQPSFFANYNLTEVTSYVALIGSIGFVSFCSRLTRRGWRENDRGFVVFVVLGVVGLLATWGNFTPLGHIFAQIPLFGNTRLQSRNVILVDLALSVFAGWFIELFAQRKFDELGLLAKKRFLVVAPALASVALSLLVIFAGGWFEGFMGVASNSTYLAHFIIPLMITALVIALSYLAVLLRAPKLDRPLRALVTVICLDIVVFVAFSATGFIAGNVTLTPTAKSVSSLIGTQGRFALVDLSGANQDQFNSLGSPNLNVFTNLPSIQGYGSLVAQNYGNTTNSHPHYGLDACNLDRGLFVQLRLETIGVAWSELSEPLVAGLPLSSRCLPITRHYVAQRYFGQLLPVSWISLVGPGGTKVAGGEVSVQLLDSYGHRFGPVVTEWGTPNMKFDFAKYGEVAAGFEVTAAKGALFVSSAVHQLGANATIYRLDNPFQQALSNSRWRLDRTIDGVAFFKATSLRPEVWLGTNLSTAKVLHVRDASWGDSWVSVRTESATVLKRSVAWLPGWRATAVEVATGRTQVLPVVRSGLIQQVEVPKGEWTIHFHYHAPYIELSLLASAVGAMLWLLVFGWWRGWFTRKSRTKV